MEYIWHIPKPPHFKVVLCTVKYSEVGRGLAIGYFDGEDWHIEWGQSVGRVISWTELPEPFDLKIMHNHNWKLKKAPWE